MLNKKTLQEFSIFSFIGLVLLLIDFGTYTFLYNLNLPLEFSKAIAYIFGSLASFYLNKKLTFKTAYKHSSLVKFLILYILSFVVNVSVNSLVYELYHSFIIAYLVALTMAVSINFIGQKFWVFK